MGKKDKSSSNTEGELSTLQKETLKEAQYLQRKAIKNGNLVTNKPDQYPRLAPNKSTFFDRQRSDLCNPRKVYRQRFIYRTYRYRCS